MELKPRLVKVYGGNMQCGEAGLFRDSCPHNPFIAIA